MTLSETGSDRSERRMPERLVDEVLPESVEWERLVSTYPVPALALAAAAGFVIGRRHGLAILGALMGAAGAQVGRSVEALLGDDPD